MNLGIIGMSEGNGHPYSWSAIFNGYDKEKMATCPFPGIPQYLSEQAFPKDAISEANVSHVWTQDYEVSRHIASASHIPNICSNLEDLAGVDAVLLARDDSENHFKYAEYFLRKGIPIYIDKPLAITKNRAEALLDIQTYPQQIYSCSALRYADELYLSEQDKAEIGELKEIEATTPKSWNTYAVHLIEPIVSQLGAFDYSRLSSSVSNGEERVETMTENGLKITFMALGAKSVPISILYRGEKGEVLKIFSDSYSAFKSALQQFLLQVSSEKLVIPREETMKIVQILEEQNHN